MTCENSGLADGGVMCGSMGMRDADACASEMEKNSMLLVS